MVQGSLLEYVGPDLQSRSIWSSFRAGPQSHDKGTHEEVERAKKEFDHRRQNLDIDTFNKGTKWKPMAEERRGFQQALRIEGMLTHGDSQLKHRKPEHQHLLDSSPQRPEPPPKISNRPLSSLKQSSKNSKRKSGLGRTSQLGIATAVGFGLGTTTTTMMMPNNPSMHPLFNRKLGLMPLGQQIPVPGMEPKAHEALPPLSGVPMPQPQGTAQSSRKLRQGGRSKRKN